jgi:tRNA(fMet)-specific endonuclease VapC
VVIAAERSTIALDDVVADEDDVTIAAITAAELLVGVELADRRRRRARQQFVENVLATLPVEPYELDTARAHARLLAHGRTSGRTRGAHDLLIAATAVARNRTVVTTDADGFRGLPGVEIRMLGGSP